MCSTSFLTSHFLGYSRSLRQVLGALASIMMVWVITLNLLAEAIHRLIEPEPVNGKGECGAPLWQKRRASWFHSAVHFAQTGRGELTAFRCITTAPCKHAVHSRSVAPAVCCPLLQSCSLWRRLAWPATC